MRCGYCNREIPEEPDAARESCGACPGGCRKVHCPSCGYANPVIPKFLRKLTRSKKDDEGGA